MTEPGAAVRVLVTRPIDQALDWVARLQAHRIDAVALPLIGIEPVAEAGPVHQAWGALATVDLLVFVSPNAVQHFFEARPPDTSWPDALWAAAPGPGTSAALRAAGVAEARIIEPPVPAGRFDSEALWAVMRDARDWRDATVRVLRGSVDDTPQGSGRDWLARQLRDVGAHVEPLAVYRRAAPRFDSAQSAVWQRALAEPGAHLWLFSSSEAIEYAQGLLAAQTGAEAWGRAAALATHPRIAARAREAGFGTVIDTEPTLVAIVAAIALVAAKPRESDR